MHQAFHNVEVELPEGPQARVVLAGDLDMADAEAVQALLADLARGAAPRSLVVDLRPLRFIDSHGVRALFRAGDHAGRAGGRLTICADQGSVRSTLELVGGGGAFDLVAEPPG